MKTVERADRAAGDLLEEALHAFEEKTGFQAQLVSKPLKQLSPKQADEIVDIRVNDHRARYIALCKSGVDRKSVISQLGRTLSDLPEQGLLIAPYVSREIAEYCRETGIQFMDTHGNAYLNAPGLYVYVKGEKDLKARGHRRAARGTANPAALRIAFILLCEPTMVRAAYRDIAQEAGVSLGAVSNFFAHLEARGLLLGRDSARDRKLLEPKRLFDEWLSNYPIVLRPKLNPRRFSAPDAGWWQSVHPEEVGAVWGGEVAAERLTGYLKPASQTLYVEPAAMKECLRKLVSTHRLRPDSNGPVEILEKFWHLPSDPHAVATAPAMLVYADLIATHEPRNGEVARMIWETRIAELLDQA